jgi:hypothetical protein
MLWFTTMFSLSFLLFLELALAQLPQFVNFTSIDPNECVAPSAYLSYYQGALEATLQCVNLTDNNPTAQQGCARLDGTRKITCFALACLNSVSSQIQPLGYYRSDRYRFMDANTRS